MKKSTLTPGHRKVSPFRRGASETTTYPKFITQRSKSLCKLFLRGIIWVAACLTPPLLHATVLFEDNFNSGAASREWVSKMCCQWVESGWYHTKSVNDNSPTDSEAVVHDKDQTWKDYKLSLKAQFVKREIGHINVLLRTNNFVRINGPQTGTAYQLEFFGSGWGAADKNRIRLTRSDNDNNSHVLLAEKNYALSIDNPPLLNIEVVMQGANIHVSVNSQPIIDVKDPAPFLYGGIGVHAIWTQESRFDDVVVSTIGSTPVISLSDVNNNGTPEIAVITHDAPTQTTIARIKDTKTGLLVKRIPFNGHFVPQTASVVSDLNGNGAPEIALLGVRDTDKAVLVEVRDSLSSVRIHSTGFPATLPPLDLAIVPNVNGKNTAGLAVLQQNDTTLRVQMKEAASGAGIRAIRFSGRYEGVNLQVLSDLNSNGKPELAVLGHNKTATRPDAIEIRDSSTGDLIRHINLGRGPTPQQLFSLPDLNSNGGQELAVLRTVAGGVEVMDSQTGLPFNMLNYRVWQPYRLAGVTDAGGNTDLALLGERAADSQIRAVVHDVLTDWLVKTVVYDPRGVNVGFISIPDTNGNGVSELVRLRQQSGVPKFVAEVRDGKTGELLKAIGF